MKKSVRNIRLALSVFLIMVLMVGCVGPTKPSSDKTGSNVSVQSTGTEELTKVDLKMCLFGNGAPDAPIVYDELSKMTTKDINATVEVSFLTNETYALLFSSGEQFDLCYTANWLSFADNARKGAFKEITPDMLTKYSPMSANEPKEKINPAKVNGKLYALPSMGFGYNYYALAIRGDFLKKYNIPDIKTFDDFGVYLDTVKNNEKDIIPFNVGRDESWELAAINFGINNIMSPGAPNCTSPICIRKEDDSLKLQYTLDIPEVINFCKKMKEWNTKGYWSKNALSNTVAMYDSFMNGKSASAFVDLNTANSMYMTLSQTHPEWDFKAIPSYYKGAVDAVSVMGSAMAIGANSKNPERALMLLDLLRYNEKYQMLTQYGIEGKHYTLSANGDISFPKDDQYPASQASPWGCKNPKFDKLLTGGLPNFQDLNNDAKARYKANPLVDFVLNTKDISEISTNVSNLYAQYGGPLYLGFVDDVDKAIATYKQKLEEAGLEKYMKAAETQIVEYQKNNN